nr:MAG TPA: alpha-aminoadipate carrier protein [Caudoviricetes sp.]
MCRCGHSVVIYPFEKRIKKLCSWCGEYVYINEREEFKDKLMKLLGGIKK